MILASVEALVIEVHAYTSVSPAKVRVTASYESANVLSTFTFDLPIGQAPDVHVGQKVRMSVEAP